MAENNMSVIIWASWSALDTVLVAVCDCAAVVMISGLSLNSPGSIRADTRFVGEATERDAPNWEKT